MRAPRSRTALRLLPALVLCLPAFAGCGGCTNEPSLPDGGASADAGGDAGDVSECAEIAIGPVQLDVQWDVETVYSAPVTTTLGGAAPDHLVFNFVNYNERIGPLAIGTFSLSEPPNDNRGPCAECVSVFVDQVNESSPPQKTFFQSAGSIRLEADPRTAVFRGRVEGLALVEVTIDPFTLESAVVEGGDCLRVPDFDVDFKYIPPEWTCDPDLYGSGGVCNCECGSYDPDCDCDPFLEGDCPEVIEDDCAEGDVCTFEGCRATCRVFGEPEVACADGQLCVFDLGVQVCIPAQGRVNTAELGQSCVTGGLGLVQYCAVENTLPGGMCDDFDGTCRALCTRDAECEDGFACWFVYGLPEDEEGMGYCRPAEGDAGSE